MSKDKKYWEDFYKKFEVSSPSPFAEWVAGEVAPDPCSIIDIGCGNGRDSKFLMSRGHSVTGVDSALPEDMGTEFIKEDIAAFISNNPCRWDVVYARFFFHAIPYHEVWKILQWCSGILAAEFRVIGDVPILYKEHDRYLLDPNLFYKSLKDLDYHVKHFSVSRGLSPMNGEDPLLARVIAVKKEDLNFE